MSARQVGQLLRSPRTGVSLRGAQPGSILPPWTPPRELNRPPIPYKTGFNFRARRVQPPAPFLGQYHGVPSGSYRDFLDAKRTPEFDFLANTTLVDYCKLTSVDPLPCQLLGEDADFEILGEIPSRGHPFAGDTQLLTCMRKGRPEPLMAKVFDPLYFPFNDEDLAYWPKAVVSLAEDGFARESAAYAHLDSRLGGIIVPKFYGSWVFDMPGTTPTRPVHFIVLEYIEGRPLYDFDPADFTDEERLRVVAQVMEADCAMTFCGVAHERLEPGNIICSEGSPGSVDMQIRVVDFGLATICSVYGWDDPCVEEALPQSPVDEYKSQPSGFFRSWVPEGMEGAEWERWLRETWGPRSESRHIAGGPRSHFVTYFASRCAGVRVPAPAYASSPRL